MKIVTYKGLANREEQIVLHEKQGYRMLHDDFDSDLQYGEEPSGTLTFTDEPTPPGKPIGSGAEIRELKKRIEILERKP